VIAPGVLASIPSPSSGALHLGPLQLRAYGLMIALGVLAAVWLTSRRVEQRGIASREDISAIALWAVPAGVVGARLYHVITDWKSFRGDWWRAFKIWEGGLGIWGGIALGVLVGLWAARRRGLALVPLLDAAAPALALAQAIGRWGNYFNQELFGKPTSLPWGLEIDLAHRPPGYEGYATFHPTFLYESLWNLGLCLCLIGLDARRRKAGRPLRAGALFALYVAGYTFARFFIERMRIDTAYKLAGLRINEWVAAAVFAGAVLWLLTKGRRSPASSTVEDGGRPDEGPGPSDDGGAPAEMAPVTGEPVEPGEPEPRDGG